MIKTKHALLFMITFLSYLSTGQCDPSEVALAGTYKVEMNPEFTDTKVAPQTLVICEDLVKIESERKENQRIFLEIGNYIVEVYSRSSINNLNTSEQ